MQQTEQFINVQGRNVIISKNLQQVVQENDNQSEKVLITMDRFYDAVDFDTKNITLYINTPINKEILVNLNTVKTVYDDRLEFEFIFTSDMTTDRGWLDIVFVVSDTSGYKWSSKQATKAMFVSGNFTTHKQPVPNEYYVDLEAYRQEIISYVNDAKRQVELASIASNTNKLVDTLPIILNKGNVYYLKLK